MTQARSHSILGPSMSISQVIQNKFRSSQRHFCLSVEFFRTVSCSELPFSVVLCGCTGSAPVIPGFCRRSPCLLTYLDPLLQLRPWLCLPQMIWCSDLGSVPRSSVGKVLLPSPAPVSLTQLGPAWRVPSWYGGVQGVISVCLLCVLTGVKE